MKHIKVSELSSQTVTAQDLRNETRPQELADFCAELERSIRGIKFVDSSSSEVVAFFPNDVYALGRVAFANYRDIFGKDPEYVIVSPHIHNQKYSIGRDQYHMKGTSNLATAVKNAKKFLRSYSPVSMYEINEDDFRRAVSKARDVLESGISELRSKLFGTRYGTPPSALCSELRGLVVSRYNFIDREFAEDVSTFFTKYDEYEALPKRSELQVSFVRVYNSFSGQQCDIVRKQDTASRYSDMVVESHKLEELPEWMLGRLSVLQMMPAFSYVEGVGASAGDGMFYVVQ
jgi:hypothetical protein